MIKKFVGGNIIVSEQKLGSIINKILIIRFENSGVLNAVRLPSLRRISISVTDKDITVFLQSEPLREYFDRFIDMFYDSVDENQTAEQVLNLFLESIDKIKTLLELDSRISEQVRKGLWGELTLLLKMLEDVSQKELINGWHGPAGAIHDFNCEGFLLEVKTHSRSARVVNISNEFQLIPNGTEDLNLVLIMAETIRGTGMDSLGEIYSQILDKLQDESLKKQFKEKCSLIGDGYSGPNSDFYDLRYNLLSISAYEVDHEDFPRIINIPPGISSVKYSVDISALNKFNNSNFRWKV